MSYNIDELTAPEWIDADFVRKVIESSDRGKNVKIEDYQITPGTASGDHFASIMFRIKTNYTCEKKKNQTISMILKTFPVEEGLKKDVLGKMSLFEAEIFMYTKVLNNCQELLNKCGYNEMFVPNLLYYGLEPHQVLVFEDLKELEYYMIPDNCLTEHQIRLVYAKLGQYHATTFKMIADGRDDLNIKGTLFSFPMIRDMEFYRSGPTNLAEALEIIPDFESYTKQIRELDFDWFLDKCLEINSAPALYNVLNHGDYHIRNMMFKNNEFDALSEVVLLDFQLPHFGSPAYDLIYMAVAIPYKYRKIAFRHYFNVFSDVLVKTGYNGKMPTYDDLQSEIKRFAYIDLFLNNMLALFIHLDRNDLKDGDLGAILMDPIKRQKFYKSPDFIKHIKEVLPELLDNINEQKNN